jgi:hypothetical protein
MKTYSVFNNKARLLEQKVKVIIISCGEDRTQAVCKMDVVNFVPCCTCNGNTVFHCSSIDSTFLQPLLILNTKQMPGIFSMNFGS